MAEPTDYAEDLGAILNKSNLSENIFSQLAKSLGLNELVPDSNGGVELTVADRTKVCIFQVDEGFLLIVAPIAALPTKPEFGLMAWLLKLNFHSSELLPFVIAADHNANLVLWGKVPIERLTGDSLAGLIEALDSKVFEIRNEIEEN